MERVARPSPDPEWGAVGSPSGLLPWKVYKAWKKGEMHKASHEECSRRNTVEVLNNAGIIKICHGKYTKHG
jgi:hypothetical protein